MMTAVVQCDIAWNDRDANFAHLGPRIMDARARGAELVVLPEMFSTGFVMDTSVAEDIDGPSSRFLTRMASETGAWVCGSCPEREPGDPRPYNSLVVCSPDGGIHRYRKMHPFTYGGEHEVFRAGDHPLTVRIGDLNVSFFVCYDLRFADEFWRLATGTDVYVVPANWPEARIAHWDVLTRARAIENQAWLVGCNRIGTGGGLRYSGHSQVIDPLGTVAADAGGDSRTVLVDVTKDAVDRSRSRYPFLRDRR
jgi:predicted amidohydrolase